MNRKILNLCIYNFKKINKKTLFILLIIIFSYNTYSAMTYTYSGEGSLNLWNLYSFTFINDSLNYTILFLYSTYFSFICFDSKNENLNIKIRCNNDTIYSLSKILSIFIFNFLLILGSTLVVLFIGTLKFDIGINWSSFSRQNPFSYMKFYSPMKIMFINTTTYTTFVTFLSEIIGLIIKISKNKMAGIIIAIIYLVTDMFVPLSKLFSFQTYINLHARSYYLGENPNNYISVKEGLIYPIVLFISLTLIICIFSILRRKVFRGNKYAQ